MGELARASPVVDPAAFPPVEEDEALEPGLRKVVATLRAFAATAPDPDKPVRVYFDYFLRPVEVLGEGRVEALRLERTRLVEGRAEGTGEMIDIPCGMVVSCIGYRTLPISGVPYDDRGGRFVNDEGRISPGLYCVGWARRGPSGTIGTNRPDGFSVVEKIAEDLSVGVLGHGGKPGRAGFDKLAEERGLDVVTFRDWKKIEAEEEARARADAPREKFVDVAEMIKARGT